MKVAWVNLTNGGMCGGYLKYLKKILPPLIEDPRITRLDMFTPAGVKGLPAMPNLDSQTFWAPTEKWTGFRGVRAAVRKSRPDVVFIPNARWVDAGAPTVVLLRNMEPMLPDSEGNPVLERVVNLARRRAARKACAKAHGLIAISDFVRDYLTDNWGVPYEKVARVYHGVELSHSHLAPHPPAAISDTAGQDFLFVAGSIRPFRGTEDAILALAALSEEHPKLRLVVAGEMEGRVSAWAAHLRDLAGKGGVASRVIWAGKLDEAEMVWCFRHCRAFIMTSRVEACPNTALEAMSQGAVILSSRNAPMPEFFRAAAVYYDAGDSTGLGRELLHVLKADTQTLGRLRTESVRRAADFTWQRCATLTVDEFHAVANGRDARVG
jgi:O-antigen biosynthesis alpha-1,2-mannosyltransferase